MMKFSWVFLKLLILVYWKTICVVMYYENFSVTEYCNSLSSFE